MAVLNGQMSALYQSVLGCRSVVTLLRVNGVNGMDPITLVVTALVAGAAEGANAPAMVEDAYVGRAGSGNCRTRVRTSGSHPLWTLAAVMPKISPGHFPER
jgi:hypothetical protein